MSMRSLEAAILSEAKTVLCNSRLKQSDIKEWTTGDITAEDGERGVTLPVLRISIAVPIACDKRKS